MKTEMNDVPNDVWIKVRAKWKYALKTGWKTDVWSRCALCTHMGYDVRCKNCPIYESGWCRGNEGESRLNIIYHNRKVCKSKFFNIGINLVYLMNRICLVAVDNILYRDEIEDSWKKDVEEFLAYIDPYCERIPLRKP